MTSISNEKSRIKIYRTNPDEMETYYNSSLTAIVLNIMQELFSKIRQTIFIYVKNAVFD